MAKAAATGNSPAGIVHLGPGGFFRAHVADYLQRAGAGRVSAISLRSAAIRDRLAAGSWQWPVMFLAPGGPELRQVTILDRILVLPEDPAACLEALAAPAVSLVTMTVTEKGYCHVPATGRADLAHPELRSDMEGNRPRTAPGLLAAALALRLDRGLPPFAVLSCDNLARNGQIARSMVLSVAKARDRDLADWIGARVPFPCSMVDRIVPAVTPGHHARYRALTGRADAGLTVAEPFGMWVIEDGFDSVPRPDLARAGAILTPDVAPWEEMKLRMLNAAHSALAWIGTALGFDSVADAMGDSGIAAFVRYLWQREIAPHLVPPPGQDLAAYAAALEQRFRNPEMHHSLRQIGSDSAQKLAQRLVPSLRAALASDGRIGGLSLAIAAWLFCLAGKPGAFTDPLGDEVGRALAADRGGAGAALSVPSVFPADLAGNPRFRAALTGQYQAIGTGLLPRLLRSVQETDG
jgi:fructuronate reductase